MEEFWKDIKGFEGLYAVSSLGRVKSLKYGKEIVLIRDKGYLRVNLYKDGVRKHFLVHRLVAEAFVPNPDGKPEVDHIIPVSIGGTNEASNLRWCTCKENQNNPLTIEKMSEAQKGEKNHKAKPVIGVNKETGEKVVFTCTYEAERALGIAHQNICSCLKGRYKSAGGYYWYYA